MKKEDILAVILFLAVMSWLVAVGFVIAHFIIKYW